MNEQESTYVKNLKIEHTRLLAAHQKVKDQNLELQAANVILRMDETHKMMATPSALPTTPRSRSSRTACST